MQLRPWPTNSFNIGAQRTRLRTMMSSLCTAPRPSSSDEKRRFVTDATRAAEGLLTDETLQEIYEITPANWANIAKDDVQNLSHNYVGLAAPNLAELEVAKRNQASKREPPCQTIHRVR